MSVYLGLDLSLSSTGVVILSNGEISDKFTIRTFASEPMPYRLAVIADKIVEVIKRICPDKVAKESPVLYLRFGAVDIGQMHGAVAYAIHKAGIEQPISVAPSTLKKFATGSGKGEKSSVKMSILEKWKEKLTDNNISDAYVLARIAGAVHGGLPAKLAYEKECLQVITKGNTCN